MNLILKFAKDARQYTLKHLSELCGISLNNIHRYIKNKMHPGNDKIEKLAYSLKIDEDLLFISFGVIPPKKQNLIKKYPIHFIEKFNEACDYLSSVKQKDEEIEFLYKKEILKYMEQPNN
jgi:transcriptional regulator with XRE-family HTH domain